MLILINHKRNKAAIKHLIVSFMLLAYYPTTTFWSTISSSELHQNGFPKDGLPSLPNFEAFEFHTEKSIPM